MYNKAFKNLMKLLYTSRNTENDYMICHITIVLRYSYDLPPYNIPFSISKNIKIYVHSIAGKQ